ncbi:biotin--[acetyl-CoA-carboxylase] ligase [Actinophytocola sp.]|uniref:biotin--[acetyl-CoA-carboxylase] ligase n=1 Tax=Actinophytocola sp. TaxID=1872138 RepID=UPI003D6BE3FA
MTGQRGDKPDELDVLVLREQLVAPNGPYAALDVVASTGSTNADLVATAGRGGADRSVLIAQTQTAGRGRRDRRWVSPAGTGIYLSVLLRPSAVPPERLGTLGLVAGLALMHVAAEAGVTASLKWPNDLMIGGAKCAGVLAESVPDGAAQAAVVGIGLNVGPLPGDVPAGPGGLAATSLAAHGARTTDRDVLAAWWLRAFVELESAWRLAEGDVERSGVLTGYREACGSIGQRVRAELPDGSARTGVAVDLDSRGQLLIKADDGSVAAISAGDVVHLRNADQD